MYAVTGSGNPVIFVVISVLVVALVYSPSTISYVFAVPPDPQFGQRGKCNNDVERLQVDCCWTESYGPLFPSVTFTVCQTCNIDTNTGGFVDCTEVQRTSGGGTFEAQQIPPSNTTIPPAGGGVFEAQPLPPSNTTIPQGGGVFEAQPLPPSGPAIPPGGGGTFETQQAPLAPGDTANPKIAGGFNTLPTDEGATGAPPSTAEETQPPTLTEEPTPPVCLEGQVLDEESNLCVLEEPEAAQEEPEQTEEGDGSEDGNNNDN